MRDSRLHTLLGVEMTLTPRVSNDPEGICMTPSYLAVPAAEAAENEPYYWVGPAEEGRSQSGAHQSPSPS